MVAWIVAFALKALVVLGVARVLPGVRIDGYGSALVVALVYALLSMFLKWLLVLLSLPFIIVTFGLFLLVINALLLWMTDKLIESFEIKSGGSLAVATVLMTLGNVLVDSGVTRLFGP